MKEYFDVLDKDRNHLGYKKERGEEMLDNEYNMGVENYIISDHKILMTKRSENKSHAGMWEVPGGCSQAGEESFDTLKREMQEEVGVKVNSTNTKLVGTKLYKKQFVDIYQTITNIDIQNIKMQEEEVSDVQLIDKDAFYKLIEENKIVPSVLDRWNYVKDNLDLNW
mgnify:FL=1